jgi:hypothetical protein
MAQWDPALILQEGHSLYGAMIRRIRKNGAPVRGMLWYQGCSDCDPNSAAVYTGRMKALVASVRKDAANPLLPWVMVQIARVCAAVGSEQWWNSIRDQQRLLPGHIRNLSVVPAIDLALDDGVHISGFDQNRLGRRCAHAMLGLCGNRTMAPQIELKRVQLEKDALSGMHNINVEFDNVAGKLQAAGRPSGFDVSERKDSLSNYYIYRTECNGNSVRIKTCLDAVMAGNAFLYYGFGTHPYCNITDSQDRPIPAFGPVRLSSRVMTPFVRAMSVSPFIPFDDRTIESIQYPKSLEQLQLQPKEFSGNFCEFHLDFAQRAPATHLVYYRCAIRCGEAMKLVMWLGYDGPVKMWFDGSEVCCDPAGTNPALPDDATIPIRAEAGTHEILIALSSNRGLAWGVFLCFERPDIPKARALKGPQFYTLPVVVE